MIPTIVFQIEVIPLTNLLKIYMEPGISFSKGHPFAGSMFVLKKWRPPPKTHGWIAKMMFFFFNVSPFKCGYFGYLYLEPVCPLFWWLNSSKQGLFQSKQGSFGFQVYVRFLWDILSKTF